MAETPILTSVLSFVRFVNFVVSLGEDLGSGLSSGRWPVCCASVKAKNGLPILLLVVLALTRIPGLLPPNFSPVYALLFCAGVYFSGWVAWLLPLGTVLITDVLLNVHYGAAPLRLEMLGNYAAYAGIVWLGRQFNRRSSWLTLLGGGILGAILFYLVSNTASWLHDPAYAKNLAGWIQALTVGTPGWPHTWEFFRNTLLSGGLFAGLFAGAMKLGEATEPKAEEDEEPTEEPEAAPEPGEAKA